MKFLHADRRTWTILVCVFFKTFRCKRAENGKVYSETSKNKNYTASFSLGVGRDNSMERRLATGLRRFGDRIPVGRDFPHPFRPALGPTQPPIRLVLGHPQGVKRPGRGVDHPPPEPRRSEYDILQG